LERRKWGQDFKAVADINSNHKINFWPASGTATTYLLKSLSQHVEKDPVTEDLRHTLGYVFLKKEREVKAKAHSASHQSEDYCWLVSLCTTISEKFQLRLDWSNLVNW
jgi:hypothetical protein